VMSGCVQECIRYQCISFCRIACGNLNKLNLDSLVRGEKAVKAILGSRTGTRGIPTVREPESQRSGKICSARKNADIWELIVATPKERGRAIGRIDIKNDHGCQKCIP